MARHRHRLRQTARVVCPSPGGGAQSNFPHLWDREAGVREAVRQLEGAYAAGVRTLVDMTVLGQGCDIGLVRAVAERTPVDIVLATGVYSVDGIPLFARFRGGRGRGLCGRGARRGLLSP
ncbi:hypothetical protein [Streptomyces sp. NBC_01361]|uniref:phosphotriesterase family protein n=1 Tax=Streptomyces sp. NBC_01361 TaxID=2903838 RepID=UPI002E375953|nr:hypothetical protein [Streptomyces sp. NBC_01361]